jgi:hypothetical protein
MYWKWWKKVRIWNWKRVIMLLRVIMEMEMEMVMDMGNPFHMKNGLHLILNGCNEAVYVYERPTPKGPKHTNTLEYNS